MLANGQVVMLSSLWKLECGEIYANGLWISLANIVPVSLSDVEKQNLKVLEMLHYL